MKTQWQKEVDRRLANLEEEAGIVTDRILNPVSVEWRGDCLYIDVEAGRIPLDESARDWLKGVMEKGP